MKYPSLNKIFLSLTTIVSSVLASGAYGIASTEIFYVVNKQQVKSSVQYRCMHREGFPATVAYTSRGAIELIRWQNDYFSVSKYTPARRCQEVSTRFQKHSDGDNLRFISTGKINNYNTICISEKTGDCKPDGILITLQPDDNPETVLRDLFNIDARRTRGGITRTDGSRKIKETIDFNQFLAESPTLEGVELNGVASEDDSTINKKPVIESPFGDL